MKIHIGALIKSKAAEQKIGSTELGKLINTSKQNIYGIYKRESIDVILLYKISKALKYNFFEYYITPEISRLDKQKSIESLQLKREVEELRAEVKRLTELNSLLQKVNVLLEEGNYQVKKKSS